MAISQRSFRTEASLAPEAATTFDVPTGFAVTRALGRVRAEVVVPRDLIRATFRTIGTLIGLSPAESLTDAERGRGQVLGELLDRAHALGANAIVRLRFDAIERVDGSTLVMASGEAMVLDPAPGFATRMRRT